MAVAGVSLFAFVFISAETVRKHLLLPSKENVLCWLHPSKTGEGEWGKVGLERGGSLTCLGGLGWAGGGGGEFVILLHF